MCSVVYPCPWDLAHWSVLPNRNVPAGVGVKDTMGLCVDTCGHPIVEIPETAVGRFGYTCCAVIMRRAESGEQPGAGRLASLSSTFSHSFT